MPPSVGVPSEGPLDPETTADLLARVREGDAAARESLVRRFLPPLERWGRGRLPNSARDLVDTDDLVQVTLLKALDRVKEFEPRRPGAFLAYLRQALLNRIRDEARRVARRPQRQPLSDEAPEGDPSPLERAIGSEEIERYEQALERLTEEQRLAVMLRVELGCSHQEVAEIVGSPSANAARMLVSRALVRLAEEMS